MSTLKPIFLSLCYLALAAAAFAGTELAPTAAQSTPAETDIWNRAALFGDLGGVRNVLADHGIAITPVYTGEVMGNLSGGAGGYNGQGHGAIYEHVLSVPVDVDLARLVPGWEGGTFHANAFWIAGPGLSPSFVGNISNTSNIQAYNTVRLGELWYQQNFLQNKVSLKLGQIAADSEFFTTGSASLFMAGTFGTFTLVTSNLTDSFANPTYPMAATAFRLRVQPIDQFYAQVGVFSGTTDSQVANNHGVAFPVNADSGALVFTELGYLLNHAPGEGLQGTYKLGSFVHTGDFDTWASRAAGTPVDGGTDYGIYGVVDQQIYAHDGRSISLFTRAGYAPADINTIEWYVDGGFNFTGFVPTRPLDVAGIAVSRSRFSGDFSAAQAALNGTNAYEAETVIEATYKVQLAPWWTVQPDFQYIVTPSGAEGSHNAAVLGLRTAVAF